MTSKLRTIGLLTPLLVKSGKANIVNHKLLGHTLGQRNQHFPMTVDQFKALGNRVSNNKLTVNTTHFNHEPHTTHHKSSKKKSKKKKHSKQKQKQKYKESKRPIQKHNRGPKKSMRPAARANQRKRTGKGQKR